jgi:hypothetical protein
MNHLIDLIGGANLSNGSNYSFVYDRFCSSDSAVYFNKGYLQVPEGVYFSGDFTVTAWINLNSYQSYSRIIDFGNGKNNENVIFSMNAAGSYLLGEIYSGLSVSSLDSNLRMNLSQWYFVTFVLNGTTGYIYLNGNKIEISNQLLVSNNITRTINYIGKSNSEDTNADAIYDDIKIFKRALSSNEILNEYTISSNNGIVAL